MHEAQEFSRETTETFKVSAFKFWSVADSLLISARKTFCVCPPDMQQLDGRISKVFSKVAACRIDTFDVLRFWPSESFSWCILCVPGRRFPYWQSRETSGESRVVAINIRQCERFYCQQWAREKLLMTCLYCVVLGCCYTWTSTQFFATKFFSWNYHWIFFA